MERSGKTKEQLFKISSLDVERKERVDISCENKGESEDSENRSAVALLEEKVVNNSKKRNHPNTLSWKELPSYDKEIDRKRERDSEFGLEVLVKEFSESFGSELSLEKKSSEAEMVRRGDLCDISLLGANGWNERTSIPNYYYNEYEDVKERERETKKLKDKLSQLPIFRIGEEASNEEDERDKAQTRRDEEFMRNVEDFVNKKESDEREGWVETSLRSRNRSEKREESSPRNLRRGQNTRKGTDLRQSNANISYPSLFDVMTKATEEERESHITYVEIEPPPVGIEGFLKRYGCLDQDFYESKREEHEKIRQESKGSKWSKARIPMEGWQGRINSRGFLDASDVYDVIDFFAPDTCRTLYVDVVLKCKQLYETLKRRGCEYLNTLSMFNKYGKDAIKDKTVYNKLRDIVKSLGKHFTWLEKTTREPKNEGKECMITFLTWSFSHFSVYILGVTRNKSSTRVTLEHYDSLGDSSYSKRGNFYEDGKDAIVWVSNFFSSYNPFVYLVPYRFIPQTEGVMCGSFVALYVLYRAGLFGNDNEGVKVVGKILDEGGALMTRLPEEITSRSVVPHPSYVASAKIDLSYAAWFYNVMNIYMHWSLTLDRTPPYQYHKKAGFSDFSTSTTRTTAAASLMEEESSLSSCSSSPTTYSTCSSSSSSQEESMELSQGKGDDPIFRSLEDMITKGGVRTIDSTKKKGKRKAKVKTILVTQKPEVDANGLLSKKRKGDEGLNVGRGIDDMTVEEIEKMFAKIEEEKRKQLQQEAL